MANQQERAKKLYGKRADGTDKGSGFLGEIKTSDGKVMTELSIGVDFGEGEMEIPSVVPTLTTSEIKHLSDGGEMTDAIVKKAVEHARKRLKAGKSPFKDDSDG